MVRASNSTLSKMVIDTLGVVCLPTYSLLAQVQYPLFSLTEQKLIYRFAQIMHRELIVHALGLQPTISFSRMVEISKRYILNSKYVFKEYSELLKGHEINVFEHLMGLPKAKRAGVLPAGLGKIY